MTNENADGGGTKASEEPRRDDMKGKTVSELWAEENSKDSQKDDDDDKAGVTGYEYCCGGAKDVADVEDAAEEEEEEEELIEIVDPERQARDLQKVIKQMEITARYERVRANTKPLPEVRAGDVEEPEYYSHAAGDERFWDDDEFSVEADPAGSEFGDEDEERYAVLGDFESAHDMNTPWHDRPKVIARKMVRLIVNTALDEVFPPQPTKPKSWWEMLCGASAARLEGEAEEEEIRRNTRM
jgi:hypothetical protein